MRKLWAAMLAAVMVCSVLTGCSGDTSGSTTEGTSVAGTEDTAETDFSWEGLNITDYITLGEYKGISYTIQTASVKDSEVQSQMDSIQQSYTKAEQLTEGKVTAEDTVNIDYTGKIDGEVFDGGTDTGYDMDIPNSTFITGFADGLVGMEVGDTKDLELKFPDDYWSKDYQGKDVIFTVTVNYIHGEDIIQEFTDEFVSEYTGGECSNEKELREAIYDNLLATAKSTAENAEKQEVWQKIMDNSEVIGYPDGLVDVYYEARYSDFEYYAGMYGMTAEDFALAQGYKSLEEAETMLMENAKMSATSEMVYRAIFAAEGMELTDKEYSDGLAALAGEYGYESAEAFEEAYGYDSIFENLCWEKAINFVMDNAVGTEAETTEAETTKAETTKAETTKAETTKGETTEAESTPEETTKAN